MAPLTALQPPFAGRPGTSSEPLRIVYTVRFAGALKDPGAAPIQHFVETCDALGDERLVA